MPRPDFLADPYSESSLFRQQADPELALAYRLQNGQANDPRLLEAIIERYAAEVTCLAYAILDHHKGKKPAPEVVCELVEGTFHQAMANLSSFWGQSSVRDWLFGILVEQARRLASAPFSKARRAGWVARGDSTEKLWFTPRLSPPESEEEARLWVALDALPEKQRIPLLLRDLCGLEIPEIARLLGTRAAQIEKYLESASGSDLTPRPPSLKGRGGTAPPSPLLHRSPAPQLLAHRWPLPSLSPAQLEQLQESVRQTPLEAPPRLLHSLRGLTFAGGLLLVFISLFFYFNRGDLTRVELPRPTPTSTALPPPIPIGAENDWRVIQTTAIDLEDRIFSSEPALSADGRYLAFTSSAAALVEGDAPSGFPDIFVYDNQTRAIERVNLAADGQPANRQSSTPSISADGRYVVFASMADNLVENGGGGGGIYLHDRSTQQTARIDRAPAGVPAAGESFVPAISADGQRIVFWSSNANLLGEARQPCQTSGYEGECLDIYVYEREGGVIRQRIPIGRPWDQFRWDRRLALSADGSRLALTLYRSDRMAEDLHLTLESEVFVYDLNTGEFIPVNVNSAGEAGDGASFAPNISADGQVVAFTSEATNLVEGDTNDVRDVFLRNLKTGLTQRVSVASDGSQAEAVSGVSRPNLAAWGDTIGLSGDGRYVAFLSESLSLDIHAQAFCEPSAPGMCKVIYLYDRVTGQPQRLTDARHDRAYLYPVLSADGQWVSYVERMEECSPLSLSLVCVDIYLYHRSTGWRIALSRDRYRLPESQWQMLTPSQGHLGPVNTLAFSPNGKILATADSTVKLWEVGDSFALDQTWKMPASVGDSLPRPTSLAFSPDGELMAIGLDGGEMDLWSVSENRRLFIMPDHPGAVIRVAFMPDGKMILAATPQAIWFWEERGDTYARVKKMDYPADLISDVALSPSGLILAIAAADKTIWLQDVFSGDVLLRLGGHTEKPTRVAFSPDGRYLASSASDGSINLWQIEEKLDGTVAASYLKTLWHAGWVRSLAFSADGRLLASGTLYDALRLWSVPEGELVDTPLSNPTAAVFALAFSPSGDMLAASSDFASVQLWRNLNRVQSPRFFVPGETDQKFLPVSTSESLEPLTLHRAAIQTGFVFRAPVTLPPGWKFREMRVIAEGQSAALYEVLSNGVPLAEITFTQWPSLARPIPVSIGVSAAVERVRVGGYFAEIVRGDWRETGLVSLSGDETITRTLRLDWDSLAPAWHLRWEAWNMQFALDYRLLDENAAGYARLTRSDLIAIAESLQPLNTAEQDALDPPIFALYTIRPGDTCTAIARRYGTIVNNLMMFNPLTNSCELIYAGEQLLTPLPTARLPILESDLNCDGRPELVRVITTPDQTDNANVFGVFVDTMQDNGFYRESWRYTVAETAAETFSWPELLDVGTCEKFLTFNVFGGEQPGGRAFRWNGETMTPVLPADSFFEDGK